jgi:hypothetical protein
LTFDSANGRNLVEIKWQILPRFYAVDFDVEGFFQRARAVTTGGRSLQTLCPEDLLLVLCVHAAKHAWTQLSWLCDIVQLAGTGAIDWKAAQTQARQLGIARIVAVTFFLAEELLVPVLSPDVLRHFPADRAVRRVAQEVRQIVTQGAEYDTESLAYFRLMVRLRERGKDKVAFLARLGFTPSVAEWKAVRLPAPLFPLYRVVRVFRLAKRLFSPHPGK